MKNMKKNYVAPVAEKINFEYKDQVVVASSILCGKFYINGGIGATYCPPENQQLWEQTNIY